jgi:aspartyl-tRNA(Asn)/glutamyl-tRNA(Gln) amidotransferase subunit A
VKEFCFTSIEDYHACLRAGETSCTEAVTHYLQAIKSSPELNAFLEVYSAEALERARLLDNQPVEGRLHGVVIGLKDNICYAGHVASAASRILENFTSSFSATAVERLLAEGAIIIGRQNCDEFGMGSTNEHSAYGPTLHPDQPDRVPGGSSGGSAAAVRKGLCMLSLGSDTGGSVRLPADYCGIVGFKPSYGTVSRHGLIAYASSFDQIGILAKSPADALRTLEVIAGPDELDGTLFPDPLPQPLTSPDRYRIAYFPQWLEHPSLDGEIRQALSGLLERFRKEGHEVEPVDFTLTEYIVPAYYVLTTAEASSNLARYDGIRFGNSAGSSEDLASFYRQNRSRFFGNEVKRRIMLGSFVLSTGYFDAYFTKAQQVRRQLKEHTDLIFSGFDFILAPNSPAIAPRLGEQSTDPIAMYMGDIFTVFANLTGVSAVSLPLFKHSSNLPFGAQVLSGSRNEVSLLRFSHQLMQQ